MKLINHNVHSWCPDMDPATQEQVQNLSQHPNLDGAIAIMPDAHAGVGTPIGTVAWGHNVIIPAMIGVDIGCGMVAARLPIKADQLNRDDLIHIVGKINATVPVGFNKLPDPVSEDVMPMTQGKVIENGLVVVAENYEASRHQIGTLGGGNHFIEIQRGVKTNDVWVMIHSGSRNLGKRVADHYISLANSENQIAGGKIPASWNLSPLDCFTEQGRRYIAEMQYCVNFASVNRGAILDQVLEAFDTGSEFCIECIHNYAVEEVGGMWLHRKGAISAERGELGIIPGSQGSKSFIVRGRGSLDSHCSASHGAGRRMRRTQAKKTLSLENEIAAMDEKGIVHYMSDVQDLDEAASAYKSIDEVIENESDLVEIVTELVPLAVIKG